MSIEIEMRGVRWRTVGRPLSVETAADRRLQVARNCLSDGQILRPVLPKRADTPSLAATRPHAPGRTASNLRADRPDGMRTHQAGDPLDAKD